MNNYKKSEAVVEDVMKEETLINKLLNETNFFKDLTEIPEETSEGFTEGQKRFLVNGKRRARDSDSIYWVSLIYKWYKVYDNLSEIFKEYGFEKTSNYYNHNTENNFKEYSLQEAKKNISRYTYFAFDIEEPYGIYK